MNIIREVLQEKLAGDVATLKDKSLSLALHSIDSGYYKLILCPVSERKIPLVLDYDFIQNTIASAWNGTQTPQLQLRTYIFPLFVFNELKFENLFSDMPFEEHKKYRLERENFEYHCENEFWKDTAKHKKYQEISDITPFTDSIFPVYQRKKIQNRGNIYNTTGWLDYIFRLVQDFFPEYTFYEANSTKNIFRFLKPVGQDLLFGFEYEPKRLEKQFDKGDITLPDFNLVLLNNNFSQDAVKVNYITTYNDEIISLGILGNPFFFPPCYSLRDFSTVDLYHDETTLESWDNRFERAYIQVNDEFFKVVHSEIYGENLKKHAFFYMDLLSYSAQSYLEFIEVSIKNCLQQ